MRNILWLVLLSPALLFAAGAPPYKTSDTPTDENFRDIYQGQTEHLHDGNGSARLHDVLPDTDSLYDLGASEREWANIYVDGVTVSTIAASSATITSLTVTTITLNENTLTSATQAQQEAETSTTTFVSPARQRDNPSSPKAWVVFRGTGTVASLSSYNVSSITDNGTGDYTVNFTTAFSSANYAVLSFGDVVLNSNNKQRTVNWVSATASAFRLNTVDDLGAVEDWARVSLVFFGDQ